ncbi:MAG: FAD-dependent thymidylate synthase [Elusimicrobiota bacterium]|jgi:thymidylate synthase (FAD)|nr:FAD-dependent thymidylate synthase [Elusimicrobiota bacterium]
MRIKLLKFTKEPEKTCAVAAKLCYNISNINDMTKRITREKTKELLDKVISSGHHSVLEHAVFTFAIEGVSRSLLAQLTRHRIASFSVQSQRYVKFSQGIEFVKPITITKNKELSKKFSETLRNIESLYEEFLRAGIPAEDARYVLPNACATKIILTMNARELRHFFALRCCNRSQWEMNAMAIQMLILAKKSAPLLFAKAGPNCVRGNCSEHKPCLKPFR